MKLALGTIKNKLVKFDCLLTAEAQSSQRLRREHKTSALPRRVLRLRGERGFDMLAR
jgi:hypothetical protein